MTLTSSGQDLLNHVITIEEKIDAIGRWMRRIWLNDETREICEQSKRLALASLLSKHHHHHSR